MYKLAKAINQFLGYSFAKNVLYNLQYVTCFFDLHFFKISPSSKLNNVIIEGVGESQDNQGALRIL